MQDLLHTANESISDLRLPQTDDECILADGREGLANEFIEGFPVAHAVRIGGKQRMPGEFRRFKNRGAETHPFVIILHGNHYGLAITGRVGAIRRDGRVIEAGALGNLTRVLLKENRNRHPVRNRFKK